MYFEYIHFTEASFESKTFLTIFQFFYVVSVIPIISFEKVYLQSLNQRCKKYAIYLSQRKILKGHWDHCKLVTSDLRGIFFFILGLDHMMIGEKLSCVTGLRDKIPNLSLAQF